MGLGDSTSIDSSICLNNALVLKQCAVVIVYQFRFTFSFPEALLSMNLKRLVKPKVVSLDAFGTLYQPREPIPLQYYKVAQKFGIEKSENEIRDEFPVVYAKLMAKYPNWGKSSSAITSSDAWWLELIVTLFNLESYSTNAQSKRFCDTLLTHFITRDAYCVCDHVKVVLKGLKRHRGIRTIVSSNSDSRLIKILQNLGLSEFIDHVYMSYDLGESKPSRQFFEKIADAEGVEGDRILHIGDELRKDYYGAMEAGWHAVLIDSSKGSDSVRRAKDLTFLETFIT